MTLPSSAIGIIGGADGPTSIIVAGAFPWTIVGAAIINQAQCDGYESGAWQYPAKDCEVMVLHTLVISPRMARRGYGRAFVAFYESYARECGCRYLRMDTNERNSRARTMYQKLGYAERGIIKTPFNGISCVNLVLLEKAL